MIKTILIVEILFIFILILIVFKYVAKSRSTTPGTINKYSVPYSFFQKRKKPQKTNVLLLYVYKVHGGVTDLENTARQCGVDCDVIRVGKKKNRNGGCSSWEG